MTGLSLVSLALSGTGFSISHERQKQVGLRETTKVWGPTADGYHVVVNGERLEPFADNYRLALVCGLNNPHVDVMEDSTIVISNAFGIRPTDIDIAVTLPPDLYEQFKSGSRLWFRLALSPRNVTIDNIKRLADVHNLGSKVINP